MRRDCAPEDVVGVAKNGAQSAAVEPGRGWGRNRFGRNGCGCADDDLGVHRATRQPRPRQAQHISNKSRQTREGEHRFESNRGFNGGKTQGEGGSAFPLRVCGRPASKPRAAKHDALFAFALFTHRAQLPAQLAGGFALFGGLPLGRRLHFSDQCFALGGRGGA